MKNSIIQNKLFFKVIIYTFSIFILYLLVMFGAHAFDNEIILPSPNKMINSFFNLLSESKTYLYIFNTIKSLFLCIVISFCIGMFLGVLSGLFNVVRLFLKPWMTICRSLPLAAVIILIMVIAGLNVTPYFVTSLVLVPIIYEGVSNAIINIDKDFIDIYKMDSKINFLVILKVYIPLIFSGIKAAFISSIGLGIKVLVMAEYMAGVNNSLGYAIIPYVQLAEYEIVYAYCIIIVIVVLAIEVLPKFIYYLYNKITFQEIKEDSN